MTEKAQRELYLAIRRFKDSNVESDCNERDLVMLFANLFTELDKLLTAPQFNLKQLNLYELMR